MVKQITKKVSKIKNYCGRYLEITFVVFFFYVGTCSASNIEWQVDRPFRLMLSDIDQQEFAMGDSRTVHEFVNKRIEETTDGRYTPFENTAYLRNSKERRKFPIGHFFPRMHPVTAWLSDPPEGQCVWRFGHLEKHQLTADCREQVKFEAQSEFGKGSTKLTVLSNGNVIATSDIRVRDTLILGLGDSYASGESNPDKPTTINVEGLAAMAERNNHKTTTGRWMNSVRQWVGEPAQWFDRTCHRSLFSQHVLAALGLSARDPHETISLLPLACSGAEVYDGLLVAQRKPPGGGVVESQINSAIRHLCPGILSVEEVDLEHPGTGKKFKRQERLVCSESIRQPDIVLLSVGGNDVGFAPVIAWATMPGGWRNIIGKASVRILNKATNPICPSPNPVDRRCGKNKPSANERIELWLPSLLQALNSELRASGLLRNPSNVLLTAYPDPTRDENGDTCSYCSTEDGNEQARSRIWRIFNTWKWDLGLTPNEGVGETELIVDRVIVPLQNKMRSVSADIGWTFVDSHLVSFGNRGMCAGYGRNLLECPVESASRRKPSEVEAFPHIVNGTWRVNGCEGLDPLCPDMRAYVTDRLRYFRNTNDSALFQNDCLPGSERDCINGRFNGAYHPDARAHGLIADAIIKALLIN